MIWRAVDQSLRSHAARNAALASPLGPCDSDLGPLPQLPAGTAHAVNAADGLVVMADFVVIRPALAVEEDGAPEGERHLTKGFAVPRAP